MKIRGIGHVAPSPQGEGNVRAAYAAYLEEQAQAGRETEAEAEAEA